MEVSGQHRVPAALSPGTEPSCKLNKGRIGSRGLSGRFGEEKNPMRLLGIEPRFLSFSSQYPRHSCFRSSLYHTVQFC
jgi:hypothetical protein